MSSSGDKWRTNGLPEGQHADFFREYGFNLIPQEKPTTAGTAVQKGQQAKLNPHFPLEVPKFS
jgi:hypothetical protein